jgi:hypothetical protein
MQASDGKKTWAARAYRRRAENDSGSRVGRWRLGAGLVRVQGFHRANNSFPRRFFFAGTSGKKAAAWLPGDPGEEGGWG